MYPRPSLWIAPREHDGRWRHSQVGYSGQNREGRNKNEVLSSSGWPKRPREQDHIEETGQRLNAAKKNPAEREARAGGCLRSREFADQVPHSCARPRFTPRAASSRAALVGGSQSTSDLRRRLDSPTVLTRNV